MAQVRPARRTRVFFDGGCRPNPGPMEAAVVIRGTAHLFDGYGCGNNSDAEWLALIRAMELARSTGLAGAEFTGDALAVIREADEALRTGTARSAHAAAFLALSAEVRPARVRWIKRAQNLAGIALAARHPR